MKGTYSVIIGLLAVFFGAACEKFEPAAPNDHDLLDGPNRLVGHRARISPSLG